METFRGNMCSTRLSLKYTGGIIIAVFLLMYIRTFVVTNRDIESMVFDSMASPSENLRKRNIDNAILTSIDTFNGRVVHNSLSQLKYDDPTLIKFISTTIERPSSHVYNLNHPEKLDHSAGQTPFIDNRLKFMRNGFFVECGALDGELGSTTLFLEKARHWTGLLIEADPENYHKLKLKHRKAFTSNTCLSPTTAPAKMIFNKAVNRGRVVHDKESKVWIKRQHIKNNHIIQICFPFYSFMLAMNRTVIDFFTLDVEGDELNVLKTIPFNILTIKMITVEYVHVPGQSEIIRQFMESKGYETLLTLQSGNGGMLDIIFKLKDIDN